MLCRYPLDVVIADEFHLCKNDATIRTKAMRKLVANTKNFKALTGTPILNNPIDLYPVLNMVDPFHFYSRKLFEEQYCTKYQDRIVGAKNHDKLYRVLKRSIMIRRTFADVKDQIEGYKTVVDQQVVPIKLSDYTEYTRAESDLESYVYETTGKVYGEGLALQRQKILKDIIYKQKKEMIFQWLDNFLLENQKITLFFTRTEHLKEFANRYDATIINGETPTNKRLQISKEFNTNNKLVLCCNIKAAGVGLDLIGCHYAGFVDLDDVWENMSQAISRFDRIGQEFPVVSVYYFVGLQTIEHHVILKKLDTKHENAKRIIDGRGLHGNERIVHD
jgi:SWI/SNF-related matrix-associated actin-dependent regulator 1 of chromatin subfamily A